MLTMAIFVFITNSDFAPEEAQGMNKESILFLIRMASVWSKFSRAASSPRCTNMQTSWANTLSESPPSHRPSHRGPNKSINPTLTTMASPTDCYVGLQEADPPASAGVRSNVRSFLSHTQYLTLWFLSHWECRHSTRPHMHCSQ